MLVFPRTKKLNSALPRDHSSYSASMEFGIDRSGHPCHQQTAQNWEGNWAYDTFYRHNRKRCCAPNIRNCNEPFSDNLFRSRDLHGAGELRKNGLTQLLYVLVRDYRDDCHCRVWWYLPERKTRLDLSRLTRPLRSLLPANDATDEAEHAAESQIALRKSTVQE